VPKKSVKRDPEKDKKSAENLTKLDQAEKKITSDQEEELISDYDAAFKEWQSKDKPYLVKFLGKTFEVPRTQPFAYALFISRHTKKRYNKEKGRYVLELIIPDDESEEYIRLMLGDRFVEALAESDVTVDFVMNHIAPDIHRMWQTNLIKNTLKNVQTPGS
jgi:hypothetical protein